ncbi:hypothetical protein COBT_001747, partial [Conglomerata obtusa]
MNVHFLESLTPEEREIIEDMHQQVLDEELEPSTFFNKVKELIGTQGLALLFSKTTDNDIKTDQLQDIIQYSGVDLKEEQDIIAKDTEQYQYNETGDFRLDDQQGSAESLLNIPHFIDFVNRIVGARGMSIAEDVYHTTYLVLRRKLADFVDKLVESSKLRVDVSRSEYTVLVENDIRRQLWCLEQNEQKEMDRLKCKKEDDEHKKKLRKTVQEREDLLIKKRMSNTVALAALGSKQKSWMNFGDGGVKENETPFQSLYSPFDEKEHERKVGERIITMQDFLHVLEHDKRYNKSIFTIQQYFL